MKKILALVLVAFAASAQQPTADELLVARVLAAARAMQAADAELDAALTAAELAGLSIAPMYPYETLLYRCRNGRSAGGVAATDSAPCSAAYEIEGIVRPLPVEVLYRVPSR